MAVQAHAGTQRESGRARPRGQGPDGTVLGRDWSGRQVDREQQGLGVREGFLEEVCSSVGGDPGAGPSRAAAAGSAMRSALHWVSAGWGGGAPEPQKALGLQLMQGEKQLTPPAPPEFWLLPKAGSGGPLARPLVALRGVGPEVTSGRWELDLSLPKRFREGAGAQAGRCRSLGRAARPTWPPGTQQVHT